MAKKYYYSIYGLTIESDLEIKYLIELKNIEKIDVIIKYDIMPEYIHKSISEGVDYCFKKKDSWFYIDDVAIYRIKEGKEIYIEMLNEKSDNVKTFLLGSAFGCALIQRNIVAIHGSTIIINNKGVIITGDMGAGKSTLTLGLLRKGYKFLADDVSVITEGENGEKVANPAYPSQKLCRDAALKFGFNITKLTKTDDERDKFIIPSINNFLFEKKKVNYIFEVIINDDESNNEVEVEEIKGIDKFNALLKNVYRISIALSMGINTAYFGNVTKIASEIKYYRIKRPMNLFTVDNQIDKIIQVI